MLVIGLKGLIILLAFWLGYRYLSPTTEPKAAQFLARAIAAIKSGDPTLALESLKIAAADGPDKQTLGNWVKLYYGKIYELQGDTKQAIANYRLISSLSAPSLDGRLALIRLDNTWRKKIEEASLVISRLEQLEQSVISSRRTDLQPQLLLLKAEATAASDSPDLALALYRELRSSYPQKPEAKLARTAMATLLTQSGNNYSVADKLQDIELLTREGELNSALAQIQLIKSELTSQSSAYYEVLSVEQQIIKKSGRNQEADHLLSIISAEAPLGVADKALLQMVKNAWNANLHPRAIELSNSFAQRFGQSSLSSELVYIKGRVLEEQGSIPEAKESYKSLLTTSAASSMSVSAGLRLAWLHRKGTENLQAAEAFYSVMRLADNELSILLQARASSANYGKTYNSGSNSDSSRAQIRELFDQKFQATYWLADTLGKLDENEKLGLSFRRSRTGLYRNLVSDDPYGHYGIFARQKLAPTPGSAATDTSAALGLSFQANDSCSDPVATTLEQQLAVFSDAKLNQLAQYEIDWVFSQQNFPQTDLAAQLRSLITRAKLYLTQHLVARGLGLIESVLLAPAPLSTYGEARASCEGELLHLAFPTPYSQQFADAQQQHEVDTALLLAIARTESHFDPEAVSAKDAQGLLQLLVSTAKQEGLTEQQNLFDPKTNINLGAKHLARLIKQFSGENIYAIAAYNAGGTPVKLWIERNPTLSPMEWIEQVGFPETKSYLKKVLRAEVIYHQLPPSVVK